MDKNDPVTEVCQQYLRNGCPLGSQCQYLHPLLRRDMTICRTAPFPYSPNPVGVGAVGVRVGGPGPSYNGFEPLYYDPQLDYISEMEVLGQSGAYYSPFASPEFYPSQSPETPPTPSDYSYPHNMPYSPLDALGSQNGGYRDYPLVLLNYNLPPPAATPQSQVAMPSSSPSASSSQAAATAAAAAAATTAAAVASMPQPGMNAAAIAQLLANGAMNPMALAQPFVSGLLPAGAQVQAELCPYYKIEKCPNRSTCQMIHDHQICKDFNYKHCVRGKNCKYAHIKVRTNERCQDFIRGTCTRGAHCRFVH